MNKYAIRKTVDSRYAVVYLDDHGFISSVIVKSPSLTEVKKLCSLLNGKIHFKFQRGN